MSSVTTVSKHWDEWKLYGPNYSWSTWYVADATITVTRNTGSDNATVQVDVSMKTTSGDNSLGPWQCVISISGATSGGGEKTFDISNAGLHIKNTVYTASQTYTVSVGALVGTLSGQIKMHLDGYPGNQGEYSPVQNWSLTYDTKGTPSELSSWSNNYWGKESTITINRAITSFREDVLLLWTSGDTVTETVTIRSHTASGSDSTTVKYTIPYASCPYNAKTRTAKIQIKTYSSNSASATLIDTKTTGNYTINILSGDTAYIPTLANNPACQAYNDVVSALGTDTAVAQYSKLNVLAAKADVQLKHKTAYGGTVTIASRVVTFSNGSSASADQTNHISSLIQSAGTVTWTYTVTDSRGYSKSVSGTYTVINSSAPSITNVTVYRGDSSGTAQDGGEYIYATATATCESLNGHNSVTLKGRVDNGSDQTMTNGTRKTLKSDADANTQYVVTLTAQDLLRPTTQTIRLAGLDCPLDIPETKHAMGIGMEAQASDDTLYVGYDAKFYGKLVKHDAVKNKDLDLMQASELLVPFGTEIVANKNLNTPEFLNVGRYYCPSYSTVVTLSNCPSPRSFVMNVRNITNDYTDTNNRTWMYLVREIIDLNGNRYYQYCQSGASISWTFGTWFRVNSSTNDEDGNTAHWLKANVGRQASLDFAHQYVDGRVHCRLDIVSGSASPNPFDGDGYVLTFMWDNSGGWDTQVFFPNGGGHPSFRKRGGGSWAKNAIQFVTTEVEKATYSNTSVKKGALIARRQGNVVSINSADDAVSVTANTWVPYIQLGERYRPNETVYVPAANVGTAFSRWIRIANDGWIYLFSSTAVGSASNFGFSTSYIVD